MTDLSIVEDLHLVERLLQRLGLDQIRNSTTVRVSATLSAKDWAAIQKLRERSPCHECQGEGFDMGIDGPRVCGRCHGMGRASNLSVPRLAILGSEGK